MTKQAYAQVNPHSPLFGVDCEMCHTTNNIPELTRIAVVNEKLEVCVDDI